MLKIFFIFIFSAACLFPFISVKAQSIEDKIINEEKAALDRWKKGETLGFIEIASDDITYFDPGLKKRITGIKEFRKHLSSFNGTFSFPSYELVNPQVQLYGDTGILTFNFIGKLKMVKKTIGMLRKFIISLKVNGR